MIELRTTPQGHPAYRRVCQEMHRLIAEEAGHRAIAEAMSFVDFSSGEEGRLEYEVDVHSFTPAELARHARGAGFEDVRIRGEELAANLFGWVNRALEATADPDEVPMVWRHYAHRGYLALQALDRALLEPRLPAAVFYNLLLSARAP